RIMWILRPVLQVLASGDSDGATIFFRLGITTRKVQVVRIAVFHDAAGKSNGIIPAAWRPRLQDWIARVLGDQLQRTNSQRRCSRNPAPGKGKPVSSGLRFVLRFPFGGVLSGI